MINSVKGIIILVFILIQVFALSCAMERTNSLDKYSDSYVEPDHNADLLSLTISEGTLIPEFSAGITEYEATIAYDVSAITVTPTAAGKDAIIDINGEESFSGASSDMQDMAVGSNLINIDVTAEDRETSKTYRISVTRQPKPDDEARLQLLDIYGDGLCWVTSFGPDLNNHKIYVPSTTDSINLTPTAISSKATILVKYWSGEYSVESGETVSAISLGTGINEIKVDVTAEDGTPNTYILIVRRGNPRIIDITPADASTDVMTNSNIEITFSEPMQINNYTVNINDTVHNQAFTAGCSWEEDNTKLIVNPSFFLARNKSVTVTFNEFYPSTIFGSTWDSFVELGDSISFSTINTVSADLSPSGTNVAVGENIIIDFSEAMYTASGWSVDITGTGTYAAYSESYDQSDISPGVIEWDGDYDQLTIYPSDFIRGDNIAVALNNFQCDAVDHVSLSTDSDSFAFSITNTPWPHVDSFSPVNTYVSVSENIVITFSEAMDANADWSVDVYGTGQYEPYSYTYDKTSGAISWSGNQLTIDPVEEFVRDDHITVELCGFEASIDHVHLIPDCNTYNFTVGSGIWPYVVSFSPSGSGKAVDLPIVITFSEPVDPAGDWSVYVDQSYNPYDHTYDKNSGALVAVWDGDNDVLTITPVTDFVRADTISVTLSGFEALCDHAPLSSTLYSFSTTSAVVPTISVFTPDPTVGGFRGAPLNSDIVVTFSEEMNTSSGWIVKVGSTNYTTGTWNTPTNTVLTVNPSDFTTGQVINVYFYNFRAASDGAYLYNVKTANALQATKTFTTWWNVSIFIESWHIYGRDIPSGADGGGGNAELYFAIRVSQEGGSDIIIACQGMNYYQTMVTGSDITNNWVRTGWWENPGTASDTMRDYLFTAVPRTTANGKVYIKPILMEYDESNANDIIVWAYPGPPYGVSDSPLCIYWDVNSDTFKCYYNYATDAEMTVPDLTGAVTPATWEVLLDGVGRYYTVSYCFPGQARINLQWRITATLINPAQ